MKEILDNKNSCLGCSACYSICPRNAIVMEADEEGFVYPIIDHSKCVDCGLCKNACPRLNRIDSNDYSQRYYAAANHDDEIRCKSSSGGVFSLLAEAFIAKGAVVFGAYMDEAFVVRHEGSDIVDYKSFYGSKYVQSNLGDVFDRVKRCLLDGRVVLFSGTPCQVAGLKGFLKASRTSDDNLYTVDFICHGVSSPKMWLEYVSYLSKRHGTLERYTFRGKDEGWHGWYPKIICAGKDVSLEHRAKDSYILLYQSLYITRPSCFECPYTSYDRVSDITMADFWNIRKLSSEMDNDKGTSELLVNSSKGDELLGIIEAGAKLLECTKKDAWQPHLEYPNNCPNKRVSFWSSPISSDMDQIMKRYGRGDGMTRLKNLATPILKKTGLYVLFGKVYRLIFVRK